MKNPKLINHFNTDLSFNCSILFQHVSIVIHNISSAVIPWSPGEKNLGFSWLESCLESELMHTSRNTHRHFLKDMQQHIKSALALSP